jgi:hypothetical protein
MLVIIQYENCYHLTFPNVEDKNIKNTNFATCFVQVRNTVSYFEGSM